jgi:phosphate/sulfate permease
MGSASPACTRRRLLRRDGGGDHHLRLHQDPRRADLDDARDHRRDPRRRHDQGRALVRWIWGQRIVTAWILTIPCSAFIAAVTYMIIHFGIEPFFHVPIAK